MADRARSRDHRALAGPLATPASPYRVTFQRPPGSVPLVEAFLGVFAPLLAAVVIAYLFRPAHWPTSGGPGWEIAIDLVAATLALLVTLLAFRNFYVLGRAAMGVRDPIPVVPPEGLRVAFIATFVPGREDIGLLRETVAGMVTQRYAAVGHVDAWVLDEGDDPEVRRLCAELGANHFSRAGVERWNTPAGRNARRTKHGNINAFLDHVAEAGLPYDVLAGVDPDHAPRPEFLERMLGYLRDERVGYVVAPQTYGNARRNVVARLAESCQFVFHSLIQRSANTAGCPMFVGTNYLVRIEAAEAIGGMADSITEDCLTGIRLNAAGWRGVYTPDELAVGEGPEPWRDYLSQQYRWSRGAIEIIRNDRHLLRGLPWRQRVHHWVVLTYYPSVGLGWPLAVAACSLYALTGATGIVVPVNVWLTLYLDVAASQLVLFLWSRRLNVSAQEEPGSSGVGGLVMGMMSAPVYCKAVTDSVLRRPTRFVVTPKGAAATRDGLSAFRYHAWWAAAVALPLAAAVALGNTAPAILTWNILILVVCLAPIGIAAWTRAAEARGAAADLADVGEVAERNPA